MLQVSLEYRDLFAGVSDLIVIPCSTGGSVTPFVEQRLNEFGMPLPPRRRMELGDLSIFPFTGGENIAAFIAYAASVHDQTSSRSAIQRIGYKLGEATHANAAIKAVTAPLLGTGAGKLDQGDASRALAEGFRKSCHDDAHLTICVLKKELQSELSTVSQVETKPNRVFISYIQASDEHKKWALELGKILRTNGVDARLDQWHLRAGMDLPQFMANELSLADRVIIISDRSYAAKADQRMGGVGWETMLIQGDMYSAANEKIKYIAIVRDETFDEALPTYLKTKFAIHWPPAEKNESKVLERLLREIYDKFDIPPLGQKPSFI